MELVQWLINTWALLPLSIKECAGILLSNFFIIQFIKQFLSEQWPAEKRKKVTVMLSFVSCAALVQFFYTGEYKPLIILALSAGNETIYRFISKYIELNAEKKNGIWTAMLKALKPHRKKKDAKDGV
jgi:hypothetical protein